MRLLSTAFFLAISFLSVAQSVLLQGVIINEMGQPLAYSSVYTIQSRNRIGTTTKADGTFSLIVRIGDSLQFSRINALPLGYRVKAGGNLVVEMPMGVCRIIDTYNGSIIFSMTAKGGGKLISEKLSDRVEPEPMSDPNGEETDYVFDKVEVGPSSDYWFERNLCKDLTIVDFANRGQVGIGLLFHVNKNGKVDSVNVLKGIAEEIDEKIVANLKGLSFAPATQNGRRVPAFCELYMDFLADKDRLVIRFQKYK